MKLRLPCSFLLLMVACVSGAEAGVTARLERDTITFDETVRLIIESDNVSTGDSPDLAALEQDFEVLGSSSTRNVSITNGRQTSLVQWIVTLEARAQGSFTIPPITVGKESTPRLRLTVLPPADVVAAPDRDFMVETETAASQVYVQQQVILTTRLFLGADLMEGSLSDPAPENTLISRIGDDIRYSTSRGGRRFNVIERRYALFPQQSGELIIPPVRFQGLVRDTSRSDDPFRFFNQGKQVSARSPALSVDVMPPATPFPGQHWLPASDVVIEDLTQYRDEFRVGQPLTRTLRLSARGLTAEQLPELPVESGGRFNVYPDKAKLDTTIDDGTVIGILEQSYALIPSEAGELVLPEISLSWWNTSQDRMGVAVLPSRVIRVAAATVGAGEASTVQAEDSGPPADETEVENVAETAFAQTIPRFWPGLSLALLLAWLTTLWLWWRSRPTAATARTVTSKSDEPSRNDKYLIAEIKQACQRNDPRATRDALLRWSAARGPSARPATLVTLADLAARTHDGELAGELRRLDLHLFGNDDVPWSGEVLAAKLGALQARPREETGGEDTGLPPLYPGRQPM